ncbi:hypothetical protein BGY98DRAFT_958882 [Russula aff. rugulosa BPL654]|nr:hypothetical protein BGY98DRAFT_958882 [Russula aff. rugulosa BPL654]
MEYMFSVVLRTRSPHSFENLISEPEERKRTRRLIRPLVPVVGWMHVLPEFMYMHEAQTISHLDLVARSSRSRGKSTRRIPR